MPLISTRGAASAQGFGEFAQSAAVNYIEDVFSTYLYTGNGSTQTITNGIDLAGEGGLVWFKSRSNVSDHRAIDTVRGATKDLRINTTDAQATTTNAITSFNSDGFSLGSAGGFNNSGYTFASWTFRKQAKFFDVVTYTGTGSVQAIPHNLGSVPGFYVVKRTDSTSGWSCYHRSLNGGVNPEDYVIALNSTAAAASAPNEFDTAPTSTHFYVGSSIYTNTSGATYVAYLFAHDAGGFGLSGADNVISCGSFTTDASGSALVGPNLGWEPQWVLLKNATSTGSGAWWMFDNMRGFTTNGGTRYLQANTSDAENSFGGATVNITSTGFNIPSNAFASGQTFIYIAIRRGPMKVPTSGTSVYQPVTYTGDGTNGQVITISGLQYLDSVMTLRRTGGDWFGVGDRLRGGEVIGTNTTTAPLATFGYGWDRQSAFSAATANSSINAATQSFVAEAFKRSPGFFDVVCDTGTGSAHTITHNLNAVPELMIRKKRSDTDNWIVYANNDPTDYLILNSTAATADLNTMWNDTAPTSTVFTVGTNDDVNQNTGTFVTYLFATVAGVSKVFSFTGNGSSQTINCGFTGGARFVMIKRIDSTGDWYVWDSARGIVASNDPHLSLNTTAAEVTTDDSVDADSTGFVVNQNSATNVNVNGATYIGLAVA